MNQLNPMTMTIAQIEAFLLAQLHLAPACIASDPAALFAPGPSRWYALRVAPQREDQAEAWLHPRGVYAFHPVQKVATRLRGQSRVYHRRYLPGYVFARFQGEPLPFRVMACPWITGALCRSDGAWGILEPRKLQAIHAMRRIDQMIETRRRAAFAPPVYLVGDQVIFREGPFDGVASEVVELLGNGGAKVCLHVFGREVLVSARTQDLIHQKSDCQKSA